MLQEIKTQEINFPKESFEKYWIQNLCFWSKKLQRCCFFIEEDISNVNTKFIKDPLSQARIICGSISLKEKKFFL